VLQPTEEAKVAKASTSKTVRQSGSKAKPGLNPNNGVKLSDSNLRKSVTEVPYTGQRGY
jgi:hypothetical protein